MRRIFLSVALAAALLFSHESVAQQSQEGIGSLIDGLTNAMTPLSGTETTLIRQGGVTKKTTIARIGQPFTASAAPGSPFLFQLWINTSSNPAAVEQWDGTEWVTVAFLNTTTHTYTVAGTLLAANNLSDLTNVATARTNLGLAIGTNVEAWGPNLDALNGLTGAANKIPYFTATGAMGLGGVSSRLAFTGGTLDLGSVSVSGSGPVPTVDGYGRVIALANLTETQVTTGLGFTPLNPANNLNDVASTPTARSNLGLAIGVNVQAYNANLAALAGLTGSANQIPYFTGAGAINLGGVSSRLVFTGGTLDLGTVSVSGSGPVPTVDSYGRVVSLSNLTSGQVTTGLGFTPLNPANNLSDVGNTATARSNLGVTATGSDTTYAYRSNNLSDLANVVTARTNLGLGTAAQQAVSYFLQVANNLSDLANVATARANLGLGSAAIQASTYFLQVANNLSDLTNAATARANLGLGTAATQASSFFLQVSNNLSDLANAATARSNLGLGSAATQASSYFAQVANNLSDLANAATALSNLGGVSLTAQDQSVSGGANLTAYSIGTVSSGTTTMDCGKSPVQYLTDNGAFTLAAPSHDGTCLLLVTNGSSAGTITFSGFTVGSSTGDTINSTNTNKFTISIWRINGVSGYRIAAMQ